MNDKWTFHTLFVPIGVIVCLVVFCIHYFLIEKPVHDYRLTFTVNDSHYNDILPKLVDYKHEAQLSDFFISPNLESKADSLKENNIRRFELKIFTPQDVSPENCSSLYFEKKSINPLPIQIGSLDFGDSTPLQKSLGIFVLLLALLLVIDVLRLKQRS